MARIPRKYLIEDADVGMYHCINRCVRRAFLCGMDEVSGKCFDHRKRWIQDRLEFLAGVFGVDVMGFAVMSNHLHCQPLLDESAMLACLAYVDLNPIRAKIAATPESSRFTSVFERIQAEREAGIVMDSPEVSSGQSRESDSVRSQSPGMQVESSSSNDGQECPSSGRVARGEWLSPLPLAREVADERRRVPACRASNKGCLPMSLADYLRLLDWTGRQLRRDKRGAIPSDVAPILQRLKITDDGWRHLVQDFSRMFRRAARTPATLATEATRRGHRWLKGIGPSRATFAQSTFASRLGFQSTRR